MSYDENDAALEDFYDRMNEEFYPEHKQQAIQEFTTERLKSFYVEHPEVMVPAVLAYREAKKLRESERYAATVIFSMTAIEVFLKATLLKPVVYGLVHHELLATVIVEHTFGQTGFSRYKKLLSSLFSSFAGIDLNMVKRDGAKSFLLEEVLSLQELRNKIIHQGLQVGETEATHALNISQEVYKAIVIPMLQAMDLQILPKGVIEVL